MIPHKTANRGEEKARQSGTRHFFFEKTTLVDFGFWVYSSFLFNHFFLQNFLKKLSDLILSAFDE